MAEQSKKVVVIGGGTGGYVAALRAAQLGAAVVLVEKNALGGTCLNRGCIPTKVLLHTAELASAVREGESVGLFVKGARVDWKVLMQRKAEIVARLVEGVGFLLGANGVEVVRGNAVFRSSKEIVVTQEDGAVRSLSADAFIVATGSVPALPPVPGFDLPGILTSDGALELDALPESILLVGGGVIGVEFASVFSALGVKVTVVEMLPEILPNMDVELVEYLRQILEARGIRILTSATVKAVRLTENGYATVVATDAEEEIVTEKVFVCTGRRPFTQGLGLEEIGVRTERGRVAVDERMRTSVPGIYAIGDCASPIMLAHVASTEGEVAAEVIMGHKAAMDYRCVPSGVYTAPELAGVGPTEVELAKSGRPFTVGRFPMNSNAKALIAGMPDGMVKVLADKETGEILGMHLLGPRATDLIVEGTLAMKSELTVDEIVATIHAHPTLGETVKEASLDVLNRALHLPPKG